METFKFTLLKKTFFVTRLTLLVPLVVQELPTLPENLSSLPVFSGVRVARSKSVFFNNVNLNVSITGLYAVCLNHMFDYEHNIRILFFQTGDT
jgi:hypothetical protein